MDNQTPPISIIIIEDESLLADNMAFQFCEAGFNLLGIASSGEEALARLAELADGGIQPQVALVDIKLAGEMDGIQVAQVISAKYDIAVIFITGFGEPGIFQRAVTTRPYAYLLKPFSLQQAIKTIDIALYQRKLEKELQARQVELETLNAELEKRVAQRTAALQKSEERYRLISEVISDFTYAYRVPLDGIPVLEWTMGGVGHSTEIKRVIADLMEAGNYYDLIHPDDRAKMERRFPLLSVGEMVELDFRIVTRKGDVRWVRDRARPIWDKNQDRMTYIYGAVQDVTESKQLEVEMNLRCESLMQDYARLESSLAACNAELMRQSLTKKEFISNIGHELRTPLNAILGHAEALMGQVRGVLNEHQLKSVIATEKSGRDLLKQINTIISLAELNTNSLEMRFNRSLTEELCQSALQSVNQEAAAKQLSLTLNIQPGVPEAIFIDPLWSKQILSGLLNNAVKFTPQGGQAGLDVALDKTRGCLSFSIWDSGIGISASDFLGIFKLFHQVDGSLVRHYEGAGLGLALVLRLVELHGGGISVESSPGQGSRFTVRFPWCLFNEEQGKPLLAAAVKDLPALNPLAKNPTILLADGSEVSLQLMLDDLRACNGPVRVARSAAEAVSRAAQTKTSLLLLGMQLPDLDSLQTLSRILCTPELAKLPVVALTALDFPGHRQAILDAGCVEYLVKPLAPGELCQVIAGIPLNNHSESSPKIQNHRSVV